MTSGDDSDLARRVAELERKFSVFEQFFRALGASDEPRVVKVTSGGQEMTLSLPAGEPVDLDAICAAVRRDRSSEPAQEPPNGYTGPRPVTR